MKHTTLLKIITTVCFGNLVTAQKSKAADDANVWPMFRKADVVTLEGKDIPDAYKRTEITDAQGRSIEGEWLVIDRIAKTIKFRRSADGEEFDISFESLCEPDQRYAELETGIMWGPPPPNISLPPELRRKTINPIHSVTSNWEWTRIDREKKFVHVLKEGQKTLIPFGDLSFEDREFAEDKDTPAVLPPENRRKTITRIWPREPITGEWVEIDPESKSVIFRKENSQGLTLYSFDRLAHEDRKVAEELVRNSPALKFDPTEPRFNDKGQLIRNNTFDFATKQLMQAFDTKEIFDHLRVRTLTTAYIYEYDNEWQGNYERDTSRGKNFDAEHARGLADIMPMLSTEPQTETVSLKERIDKIGLKLYEENAPRKPPGREDDKREYGRPGDGLAQACHFVAQYIGLTKGKAKVPYIDFIKETTPLNYGAYEGHPMWVLYDRGNGPKAAVEKAHRAKVWWHPPVIHGPLHNFLTQKITRQYLRTNKPVVVTLVRPGFTDSPPDTEEGYAVIVGFFKNHEKTTYEAFVLNGPSYGGSSLRPPFEVSYKPSLEPEYLEWSNAIFIE